MSAQELIIDNENKTISVMFTRETTMSQDDVLGQILAYNLLNDVVVHGNMIAGDIPPVYLDYESAGYSRMRVPLYLSNGRFTARMVLRFKEGKYLVEVVNLRFVDTQSSLPGTTYMYDCVEDFAFNITEKLTLLHIDKVSMFFPVADEWK